MTASCGKRVGGHGHDEHGNPLFCQWCEAWFKDLNEIELLTRECNELLKALKIVTENYEASCDEESRQCGPDAKVIAAARTAIVKAEAGLITDAGIAETRPPSRQEA